MGNPSKKPRLEDGFQRPYNDQYTDMGQSRMKGGLLGDMPNNQPPINQPPINQPPINNLPPNKPPMNQLPIGNQMGLIQPPLNQPISNRLPAPPVLADSSRGVMNRGQPPLQQQPPLDGNYPPQRQPPPLQQQPQLHPPQGNRGMRSEFGGGGGGGGRGMSGRSGGRGGDPRRMDADRGFYPPQNQPPIRPQQVPMQPPPRPPLSREYPPSQQPAPNQPIPATESSKDKTAPAANDGTISGAQDHEKAALIMQVLQLSDEQISMLPLEQKQSILILKEQISKSST